MTVFHGAANHDLLLTTGAVTAPRRRRWPRPLCPYNRRPCRMPRCVLCRWPRIECRWPRAAGLAIVEACGLIGIAAAVLALGLAL